MPRPTRISVVGLGYVGLPLAVALGRHYAVTGFDTDATRIAELAEHRDRTGEISEQALRRSRLCLTADADRLAGSDFFIITVPTPVDADNEPDLSAVREACEIVGRQLAKGAIVVLESTVWPGLTEEICGPELARISGLDCGRDFLLGYSPERINPGDSVHAVDKIVKVVAGQTPETADRLAALYGAITEGGIFVAKSIRTAEAAKVIENAQRDINIAFVNEIAMIAHELGLSTRDILATAATKWNFLGFEPGLVGGHCIGVDPYYLAHRAQQMGHHPEVILAGRRINDAMGAFVARQVAAELAGPRSGPVLVLGLTFKENVADLRNSQVIDIVDDLRRRGYAVDVHDPLADRAKAMRLFGIELASDLAGAGPYAAVIGAVAHAAYRGFTAEDLVALLRPGALVADVRGMWRELALPEGFRRWEL